jgi:hypothetical protein
VAAGTEVIVMKSAITAGEFIGRIKNASAATVFGRVLRFDLDTTDLRDITGAVIDRYFKQPPG